MVGSAPVEDEGVHTTVVGPGHEVCEERKVARRPPPLGIAGTVLVDRKRTM